MTASRTVVLALLWASLAFSQSQPVPAANPHVTALAVWNPNNDVLQQTRRSCLSITGPEVSACFVKNMQRAGASAEAVAFAHSIKDQGYLNAFVPAGHVDIAYVMYPFRANQNEGCLLVNGTPDRIDVDNLRLLNQKAMKADSGYTTLAAKNPNIALWPGDRYDRRSVTAGATSGGGQRFLVDYFLLAGCHACARLGKVQFAFDFDSDGKFLRTSFVKVLPPSQ